MREKANKLDEIVGEEIVRLETMNNKGYAASVVHHRR